MEKYIAAALLSFTLSVNAQTIRGTMPVVCADAQSFVDAVTPYGEQPVLTALSSRDMGDGLMVPTSLVVFLNTSTGTFTIAEKVDNMYCVIAMGENMKPYFEAIQNSPNEGT